MKKVLLGVTILAFILVASPAIAGDTSLERGQVSAPASYLGSIVGKTVSVYSDTVSTTNVPVYPTVATVASTTVPTKYKSKNQWLVIHATLQENCTSDMIGSAVFVANLPVYPDDGPDYLFECSNNNGFETRTRTWFLPPENLGGRPVNPGATVDVKVSSLGGTGTVTMVSLTVQAVK